MPLTEYETQRQHVIEKNKEILCQVFDEAPAAQPRESGPVLKKGDAAFETLHQIHSSASLVQEMLGGPIDITPLPQQGEKATVKRKGDVDVYSILAFGGPCRHTRSARRELTDFLENEDSETPPAAKKPKTEDVPVQEEPEKTRIE